MLTETENHLYDATIIISNLKITVYDLYQDMIQENENARLRKNDFSYALNL